MSLDYEINEHLIQLSSVLDEYTEWFMRSLRFISYPLEDFSPTDLAMPKSFLGWAEEADQRGLVFEALEEIHKLHADFAAAFDETIKRVEEHKQPPDIESFDRLLGFFEKFIYQLRRLEADVLGGGKEYDGLTGLRSVVAMEKDLAVEMSRIARQGKPFSIALVRIDNLNRIRSEHGDDVAQDYIKIVCGLIKKSLRSFDDAYRLDGDEFILSLKQADMLGGVDALERLRVSLRDSETEYELDGKKFVLTISSCVAEPLAGDDIEDLLDNLRYNLDKVDDKEGAILEYTETSPLQRYIAQAQD